MLRIEVRRHLSEVEPVYQVAAERAACEVALPRAHFRMQDEKSKQLRSILSSVDAILRKRLKKAEIKVDHALVAMTSDGAGVIRSNLAPSELGPMAIFIATVVTENMQDLFDPASVH